MDDRPLRPGGNDDEVAVPGAELLEREQDLVALGAPLGPLHVLLRLPGRKVAPGERLLRLRVRLDRPLGREGEDGLRGRGRLEVGAEVHGAGDGEQLQPAACGVLVEEPLDAIEAPGGDPRDRGRLVGGESRRAPVDLRADGPLGEPPKRDELAAGADRLRERAELVGDEDDDGVRRRLLQVLRSASAASAFSRCAPKMR